MHNRFVSLTVLVLLCFSVAAFSQITIGPEDVPTAGSAFVEIHAGEIIFDPLSPGANRNWNISSYTYTVEGTQNWLAPGGAAGGDQFPTATIAMSDNEGSYSFLRVASNGAYILGIAGMDEDELVVVPLDNEALMIPFPLAWGAEWTSVMKMTMELVPGFVSMQVDSTIHQIDAWGQMTTPSWSSGALRDLQHEFSANYLNGQLMSMDEEWNYFWWTEIVGNSVHYSCDGVCDSPSFINGDLSVQSSTGVSDAPARGPVVNEFTVGQNYPNPFNPTTSLPISLEKAGTVEITIYNELGEVISSEIRAFGPGEHTVGFDGSAWASGNYFAQVKTDGQMLTKRMTLVK